MFQELLFIVASKDLDLFFCLFIDPHLDNCPYSSEEEGSVDDEHATWIIRYFPRISG